MGYREVLPPVALRGEVECAWLVRVGADAPAGVQQVLPDGCMDLVWTGRELLVAGPDTGPHPAQREPGDVGAGLRFAPGRLPALLGVPAIEVRDQRVPLEAVRPELARRARARLEQGHSPVPVLLALTAALPGSPAEAALRVVTTHLDAGASARATADRLGWTERSLHRRCLAAFGYGPAVLRRVLRFRRAAALLYDGVPIAQAAAVAGYADQPHLSREVRALAGVAPSQLPRGA
ncbi:helix-turn-helix domain-containing protein [Pseudonocardia sp. MH-G8]|uniref:helix-turn-helix domain-containing protein n=1 Tax=Pseudonocardia sp. MH-G8 TaxID=1854588 RepID=UPI000B9FDAC2|nr:helix-turn-helix domain-containing protein [Pseudonocardia sp. MH-G8]OZM78508.1 AraC family transcriptional regulator [Pseudonocardia sp. MH-G8]